MKWKPMLGCFWRGSVGFSDSSTCFCPWSWGVDATLGLELLPLAWDTSQAPEPESYFTGYYCVFKHWVLNILWKYFRQSLQNKTKQKNYTLTHTYSLNNTASLPPPKLFWRWIVVQVRKNNFTIGFYPSLAFDKWPAFRDATKSKERPGTPEYLL